jgi:hypothetical protein
LALSQVGAGGARESIEKHFAAYRRLLAVTREDFRLGRQGKKPFEASLEGSLVRVRPISAAYPVAEESVARNEDAFFLAVKADGAAAVPWAVNDAIEQAGELVPIGEKEVGLWDRGPILLEVAGSSDGREEAAVSLLRLGAEVIRVRRVSGEAHGKASLLPGGEKLGNGSGVVEVAVRSYNEAGLKAARIEEREDSLGLVAGIDESATVLVYEDIGILSDRTYRQSL